MRKLPPQAPSSRRLRRLEEANRGSELATEQLSNEEDLDYYVTLADGGKIWSWFIGVFGVSKTSRCSGAEHRRGIGVTSE